MYSVREKVIARFLTFFIYFSEYRRNQSLKNLYFAWNESNFRSMPYCQTRNDKASPNPTSQSQINSQYYQKFKRLLHVTSCLQFDLQRIWELWCRFSYAKKAFSIWINSIY